MNIFKFSFFGLATIAILSLAACCTTEEVVQGNVEPPKHIEMEEINQAVLTGNGEEPVGFEKGYAIRNQEDWDALRVKMNAVNHAQGDVSIDFERSIVVAFFDKIRPNGGYTLEIVEIIESDIVIKVMYKSIAPSGMATDIMTQPFHIVKIPKAEKLIVFSPVTE